MQYTVNFFLTSWTTYVPDSTKRVLQREIALRLDGNRFQLGWWRRLLCFNSRSRTRTLGLRLDLGLVLHSVAFAG